MRNASIENLIVLLHMDRLLTKHRQFRTLYSLSGTINAFPSLPRTDQFGLEMHTLVDLGRLFLRSPVGCAGPIPKQEMLESVGTELQNSPNYLEPKST